MLGKIVSPNTPSTQRHTINTTKQFTEWKTVIAKNMGHLSNPEITVLALWSFGIILARTCGQSKVVTALACHLKEKEDNLRQRLREWNWDKKDKQGKKRTDWQVNQNFVPLLKWILTLWPKEERQLVLAIDATSLKKLFVVLSISVVYRGCAIPIAWAVSREGKPGAWKEPWLGSFKLLEKSIPSDWLVIVMSDRGLYAPWLYKAIQACGWHPFMRINMKSKYRPKGAADFRRISQLLSCPGSFWSGEVTCFAHNSIECTLLACWGSQYKQPWLILTDLPPESASAAWYGMRSWIEDGFKDLKRDGWQWQNTRMADPARAARFWLALAVATLWVVSVGGEADANLPASSLELLPLTHIARRTKKRPSKPRLLSCFTRGLFTILAALIAQQSIPLGVFIPEPWTLKTYP
jgi:hypothetical protein